MLQTQKSRHALDKSLPAEEEAGLVEMVYYLLGIVRHQIFVIASVALIVACLGFIYLWLTPPTFTAKAQIFIDRGKSTFVQQQTVLPDAPIDGAQVESQIQLLASDRVATMVVKNLHLTEDPEFVGSGASFFSVNSAPPSEADRTEQVALALLRNLQVNRIGAAFIVEISYRSRSPMRAAQIANAFVEAYILDQMDSKYKTQLRATEWLQARLTELRQQAATSEEAVADFKAKNNIVEAGGTSINEQEVGELTRQLVAARAKTSDAQARLNRIEQVLRCVDAGGRSKEKDRAAGDSCVDAAGSDVYGAVSDLLSNPIITKLRQQYLELVNREADISTRYGHDHAAAVNLRNQIRDTQSSMLNEVRRLAESYKSDYLISKQRQEALEKDLAKSVAQSQEMSKTQATLRELESNAQSARSVYDVFLKRYTESLQQQTNMTTEVRVVASAVPPQQPTSQKSILMILAISAIGGLGAGIGVAFLRTMTHRVFRTPGQVESILHVPCVALVPLVNSSAGMPASPPPRPTTVAGLRTISHDESVFWRVLDSPLSAFAEAIRSIKLAADLQPTDGLSTVVGFTSSIPNEGKTTNAAAVALLMGQVGRRVLVVDCDLRNPSLTRALAPGATSGIVDVLRGEKSLDQVSWKCPLTKVTFLPSVARADLLHTSEILASPAIKKLFEQLRRSYDYIVVDLPPLAPIIDVRATGHLVDFYFLVVEWGATRIDIVQHAINRSHPVSEGFVGAVLNKTDMDQMGRFDVRRSDYYSNKYYGRYGYTN